ncbi:MAG: class I SAM-dependent methyltransferase [Betaproteobacteria bacterium]|nr:class I SAM-dependent methyltransferase [Betaproteobacteria bacterium]
MLFEIKEFLDGVFYPVYLVLGRRPWRPGYHTAKKRGIDAGIDSAAFAEGKELPKGYGWRIDERIVEYPWLFSQLPAQPGKMLDAGSALNHRFLLDLAPLSNASLTIMTLAPEKRCFWNRSISYVYGDLRNTGFASGVFDVIVSVSTIEHIGLDNTLHYTGDASKKESDALGFKPAVSEFKRLLKPGGVCLITVPYGRRGVHGWYQVFDAALVEQVIASFSPAEYTIEYFGYGETGWARASAKDIADAEFFDIHAGKPYAQDFAAGARGVACIRMTA